MAEFVRVIQERNRMCASYSSCQRCTFGVEARQLADYSRAPQSDMCALLMLSQPESVERRIIEWAEKHPCKTMIETFIDSKPGTFQLPDGSFRICPNHVNPEWTNLCTDGAGDCRACWGREV